MNRIAVGAVLIAAMALSGCASLNEGLKNVNEGLGKVVGNDGEQSPSQASKSEATPRESTLTYDGGGTRVVSFTIPAGHCAPDEFVHDFETGYVKVWNSKVSARETKYIGKKSKADKDAVAALRAKQLKFPPPMPIPAPEEIARRAKANCPDGIPGSLGERQAFNDAITDLPE